MPNDRAIREAEREMAIAKRETAYAVLGDLYERDHLNTWQYDQARERVKIQYPAPEPEWAYTAEAPGYEQKRFRYVNGVLKVETFNGFGWHVVNGPYYQTLHDAIATAKANAERAP